jgi:undecaprenyl-diphosphatase
MNPHLTSAIMGLVEGLTEFLPISSTGHLILADELMNFEGELAKTFEVFIQLGAILAVLISYRTTFLNLFLAPSDKGFRGANGIVLLLLSTLPGLIGGLLGHGFIKEHLFTSRTVAIGLAVGGLWILLAERFHHNLAPRELDRMTWKMALGVGPLPMPRPLARHVALHLHHPRRDSGSASAARPPRNIPSSPPCPCSPPPASTTCSTTSTC